MFWFTPFMQRKGGCAVSIDACLITGIIILDPSSLFSYYSKVPLLRPLKIKTTLAIKTTCFSTIMYLSMH